MSNRHLARTLAMQALYQWDFLAHHPERNVDEIVRYIREEFAPEFNDHDYVEKTVRGVVEHLEEIDRTLEQFAKEWLVSAMTLVDRNVLRIGAYELLMNPNIPAKVAINEAIEIAKAFGGETSGKFVNGVLGAVYKDQIKRGITKDVDKPKEPSAIVPSESPIAKSE